MAQGRGARAGPLSGGALGRGGRRCGPWPSLLPPLCPPPVGPRALAGRLRVREGESRAVRGCCGAHTRGHRPKRGLRGVQSRVRGLRVASTLARQCGAAGTLGAGLAWGENPGAPRVLPAAGQSPWLAAPSGRPRPVPGRCPRARAEPPGFFPRRGTLQTLGKDACVSDPLVRKRGVWAPRSAVSVWLPSSRRVASWRGCPGR